MIYIYNKSNRIYIHTDKSAANQLDNLTDTDLIETLTEQEFANKGGQPVRIINGQLHYGETDAEKQKRENNIEIQNLKSYLASTDYVAIKIAEGEATKEEYAEVLQKRHEARVRIGELENV